MANKAKNKINLVRMKIIATFVSVFKSNLGFSYIFFRLFRVYPRKFKLFKY